jgi:peptidoglycan/xylan/chitin deacetylase (PgdA/CDA1 family)
MISKTGIARIAGKALKARSFEFITSNFFKRRAPIVFYHGLWPKDSDHMNVFGGICLDRFRRDMQFLASQFRFVKIEEILHKNTTGTEWPDPVIAVCFDDGHNFIGTGSLEILQEFRISATMFVITACVGNSHLMWMHKLTAIAHLRGSELLLKNYNQVVSRRLIGPTIRFMSDLPFAARAWPMRAKDEIADEIYALSNMPDVSEILDRYRPYLSWDALHSWVELGHDVGLHTRTHPFCSRLTACDLEDEIISPAAEIRERIGAHSLAFAYPFGDRLSTSELELGAFQSAGLSSMLGVTGVSKLGTSPWRLERVEGEFGLDHRLFGRPILQAALEPFRLG